MPTFHVLVVRRTEESATIELSAKNEEAAWKKAEKLLEETSWAELTKELGSDVDSEETTVESATEV